MKIMTGALTHSSYVETLQFSVGQRTVRELNSMTSS